MYPEKLNPYLNKDLKTYEDFVLYEPDGPLFEVKTFITMLNTTKQLKNH